MSDLFLVGKGIYIDMECTGIRKVEEGIFIPTGYHTSESLPQFQKDLAAFLKKWFPNKDGDIMVAESAPCKKMHGEFVSVGKS